MTTAPEARLQDLLRYLDFTPDDAAALAPLRGALAAERDALVDEFYRRLLADPTASDVVRLESRLERLKASLKDWLDRLFVDAIDDDWFARRSRIGRRHVEVGLPQRYMPLAMDVVRGHVTGIAVERCGGDPARLARTLKAVNKLLDLELTVMLDTYHADTIAKLRQVERLQTIARLAAGVSFGLKNPLGVINTSVSLMRRTLGADDGRREPSIGTHLDRIDRASRQATDMTDQLLDYSNVRSITRQTVPAAAIADDAVARVDAGEGIRIDCVGSEKATLFVDPLLLVRVLTNLVRNGVQSIAEAPARRDGTVTIRWRSEGGFDVLEVEDDGPGVPEAIRERIFEPLFTTRARGTGLGLALSRDIVAAHGGTLELLDDGRSGASFRIRLPQRAE